MAVHLTPARLGSTPLSRYRLAGCTRLVCSACKLMPLLHRRSSARRTADLSAGPRHHPTSTLGSQSQHRNPGSSTQLTPSSARGLSIGYAPRCHPPPLPISPPLLFSTPSNSPRFPGFSRQRAHSTTRCRRRLDAHGYSTMRFRRRDDLFARRFRFSPLQQFCSKNPPLPDSSARFFSAASRSQLTIRRSMTEHSAHLAMAKAS